MKKISSVLIAGIFALCMSSSVFASLGQFAGSWTNIDSNTGGITAINIIINGTNVSIQAWGKCHPTDCYWGQVPALAYAPDVSLDIMSNARALSAVYNHGFSVTILSIHLKNPNELQVEDFTRFTDGSGRTNISAENVFAKNGSTEIWSENFEGDFPGFGWLCGDSESRNGNDYWDDQSITGGAKAWEGRWSCYCADISDRAGQRYDDYMNAYLQLKSGIDVSQYSNVQLHFKIWYDTESGYDFVRRYYSGDGVNWKLSSIEWTGKSNGWKEYTFNLLNFNRYWVKFVFYSDYSICNYEGAYIDDIVITGVHSSSSLAKSNAGEPSEELIAGEIPENIKLKKELSSKDLTNSNIPEKYMLEQNYPNPFNPITNISFSVPEPELVELKVFNLQGQLVKTLISNETTGGYHTVSWDGTDNAGNPVAGGVYLYSLKTSDYSMQRKMILLK